MEFQQKTAAGQFNHVILKEEETAGFSEESEMINLPSDLDYHNGEFKSSKKILTFYLNIKYINKY